MDVLLEGRRERNQSVLMAVAQRDPRGLPSVNTSSKKGDIVSASVLDLNEVFRPLPQPAPKLNANPSRGAFAASGASGIAVGATAALDVSRFTPRPLTSTTESGNAANTQTPGRGPFVSTSTAATPAASSTYQLLMKQLHYNYAYTTPLSTYNYSNDVHNTAGATTATADGGNGNVGGEVLAAQRGALATNGDPVVLSAFSPATRGSRVGGEPLGADHTSLLSPTTTASLYSSAMGISPAVASRRARAAVEHHELRRYQLGHAARQAHRTDGIVGGGHGGDVAPPATEENEEGNNITANKQVAAGEVNRTTTPASISTLRRAEEDVSVDDDEDEGRGRERTRALEEEEEDDVEDITRDDGSSAYGSVGGGGGGLSSLPRRGSSSSHSPRRAEASLSAAADNTNERVVAGGNAREWDSRGDTTGRPSDSPPTIEVHVGGEEDARLRERESVAVSSVCSPLPHPVSSREDTEKNEEENGPQESVSKAYATRTIKGDVTGKRMHTQNKESIRVGSGESMSQESRVDEAEKGVRGQSNSPSADPSTKEEERVGQTQATPQNSPPAIGGAIALAHIVSSPRALETETHGQGVRVRSESNPYPNAPKVRGSISVDEVDSKAKGGPTFTGGTSSLLPLISKNGDVLTSKEDTEAIRNTTRAMALRRPSSQRTTGTPSSSSGRVRVSAGLEEMLAEVEEYLRADSEHRIAKLSALEDRQRALLLAAANANEGSKKDDKDKKEAITNSTQQKPESSSLQITQEPTSDAKPAVVGGLTQDWVREEVQRQLQQLVSKPEATPNMTNERSMDTEATNQQLSNPKRGGRPLLPPPAPSSSSSPQLNGGESAQTPKRAPRSQGEEDISSHLIQSPAQGDAARNRSRLPPPPPPPLPSPSDNLRNGDGKVKSPEGREDSSQSQFLPPPPPPRMSEADRRSLAIRREREAKMQGRMPPPPPLNNSEDFVEGSAARDPSLRRFGRKSDHHHHEESLLSGINASPRQSSAVVLSPSRTDRSLDRGTADEDNDDNDKDERRRHPYYRPALAAPTNDIPVSAGEETHFDVDDVTRGNGKDAHLTSRRKAPPPPPLPQSPRESEIQLLHTYYHSEDPRGADGTSLGGEGQGLTLPVRVMSGLHIFGRQSGGGGVLLAHSSRDASTVGTESGLLDTRGAVHTNPKREELRAAAARALLPPPPPPPSPPPKGNTKVGASVSPPLAEATALLVVSPPTSGGRLYNQNDLSTVPVETSDSSNSSSRSSSSAESSSSSAGSSESSSSSTVSSSSSSSHSVAKPLKAKVGTTTNQKNLPFQRRRVVVVARKKEAATGPSIQQGRGAKVSSGSGGKLESTSRTLFGEKKEEKREGANPKPVASLSRPHHALVSPASPSEAFPFITLPSSNDIRHQSPSPHPFGGAALTPLIRNMEQQRQEGGLDSPQRQRYATEDANKRERSSVAGGGGGSAFLPKLSSAAAAVLAENDALRSELAAAEATRHALEHKVEQLAMNVVRLVREKESVEDEAEDLRRNSRSPSAGGRLAIMPHPTKVLLLRKPALASYNNNAKGKSKGASSAEKLLDEVESLNAHVRTRHGTPPRATAGHTTKGEEKVKGVVAIRRASTDIDKYKDGAVHTPRPASSVSSATMPTTTVVDTLHDQMRLLVAENAALATALSQSKGTNDELMEELKKLLCDEATQQQPSSLDALTIMHANNSHSEEGLKNAASYYSYSYTTASDDLASRLLEDKAHGRGATAEPTRRGGQSVILGSGNSSTLLVAGDSVIQSSGEGMAHSSRVFHRVEDERSSPVGVRAVGASTAVQWHPQHQRREEVQRALPPRRQLAGGVVTTDEMATDGNHEVSVTIHPYAPRDEEVSRSNAIQRALFAPPSGAEDKERVGDGNGHTYPVFASGSSDIQKTERDQETRSRGEAEGAGPTLSSSTNVMHRERDMNQTHQMSSITFVDDAEDGVVRSEDVTTNALLTNDSGDGNTTSTLGRLTRPQSDPFAQTVPYTAVASTRENKNETYNQQGTEEELLIRRRRDLANEETEKTQRKDIVGDERGSEKLSSLTIFPLSNPTAYESRRSGGVHRIGTYRNDAYVELTGREKDDGLAHRTPTGLTFESNCGNRIDEEAQNIDVGHRQRGRSPSPAPKSPHSES